MQFRKVGSASVGQLWGRNRCHGPPSRALGLCSRFVRCSRLGRYLGACPTTVERWVDIVRRHEVKTREGKDPTRFPTGKSAVQGCPYMAATRCFTGTATSHEHRRTGEMRPKLRLGLSRRCSIVRYLQGGPDRLVAASSSVRLGCSSGWPLGRTQAPPADTGAPALSALRELGIGRTRGTGSSRPGRARRVPGTTAVPPCFTLQPLM